MKKILILSPSNEGTIASCTLNLYQALQKVPDVDIKCLLLYKQQNGFAGFDTCDYIVDQTDDCSNNLSYFKKIKAIRKYKKEFCPNITISTLIIVNTLNILAGGKDKKVGIFHSPFKQAWMLGFANVILQFISYLFLYPLFDRIFCVSEEPKSSVLRFPTVNKNKVKVVYNIHNMEKIKEMSMESIGSDAALFDKKTILYCGRLDSNKAPLRAIKAFEMTKFSQYGRLILMGSDFASMEPEINSYIENHNLQNKVYYIGPKSNPYKYMKAASALVSSSYSEGLPGVIIESLVLNKPIITTNSSEGIWEIMEVHQDYDKNLSGIFKTPVGYISSNLAHTQKSKEEIDIKNLAEAMDATIESMDIVASKFIENVKDINVLKNYIEL